LTEIRGFAAGLLKDFDAVRAGLTQPWSSCAVEGNTNRIKVIKRRCTAARDSTYSCKRILARP
jgi:transposase